VPGRGRGLGRVTGSTGADGIGADGTTLGTTGDGVGSETITDGVVRVDSTGKVRATGGPAGVPALGALVLPEEITREEDPEGIGKVRATGGPAGGRDTGAERIIEGAGAERIVEGAGTVR